MAGVPFSPEQVTAEWLSEALGGTVSGFEIERIAEGMGIVGRLYRISLEGEGVPSSVVAKFQTTDPAMRDFVAIPLRFYEKEVRFYDEIAGDVPISTPQAHVAHTTDSQEFVLLLEDINCQRTVDQLEGASITDARTAVDALASNHTKWWDSPRFTDLGWLPALTEPPNAEVLSGLAAMSLPQFLEVAGDRLTPDVLKFAESLPERMEWFCGAFSGTPQTLIHGDYRLDNFFFGDPPGQAPITVVDWQICFRGRAAYDLAYFTSQSLNTRMRRSHEDELVSLYRSRLEAAGISYPELMDDYRTTVAYCLIYPVVGLGTVDLDTERAVNLEMEMLARCTAAIDDNDALAVLP